MRWDELFKAFFHALSPNEVDLWEEELKLKMSNLKPDELEASVRSIAERQRKGDLKHRPTLNTLISQIIKSRYDARQGEMMPAGTCGLCENTGWIPYLAWHDLRTGIRTMGTRGAQHPGQAERDEAVPCLCSSGEKALSKNYPPQQHDEMQHIAEHVRKGKVT